MKKSFILGIFLFVLLILTGTYFVFHTQMTGNQILSIENVTGADYLVEIEGFMYQPFELTVKVGETVKWTNKDSTKHTVTSTNGGPLSSELLNEGESYSHIFTDVGEYEYSCSLHPYMQGKIIVE